MQALTGAHSSELALPPQLPFRSLSDLMTEHFQAYGTGIWNAILKGAEEINRDIPYHQQSLCARVTQTLLEKFRRRYLESQQYTVNDVYCQYAKEAFDRAAKECKRASDEFWASDFSTSSGRVGYDLVLLAHVTELNSKEQRAREQYDALVHAMNYGLITTFK